MQDAERLLTSEVCHAMVSKLAFLAGAGQKDVLEAIGVSDAQISLLEKMSFVDVRNFVEEKQQPVELLPWVHNLLEALQDDVPEPYREYLLYGANNDMMLRFFRIGAAQCGKWRRMLTIEKPFRARVIGHKKHSDVCKTLAKVMKNEAVEDFRDLSFEGLFNVAKTHQVSLGALWNELESWEKQNEQKNSKA
ncbi:TPA: STY4526/YPO1902 family pathogenicity island replication protein [Vibrio parahaemolyticus]